MTFVLELDLDVAKLYPFKSLQFEQTRIHYENIPNRVRGR